MTGSDERKRLSRVLIVEDDDAQRATLASLMKQEGFEPISCASATQALEHAKTDDFGVAVVDLRLPDIEGTKLVEQMHDLNGRVRSIIHTAYGSFDSAKESVNSGAFAYVEKAGDPEVLIQHVRRAFREQIDIYTNDLEKEVARQTASLRQSEERFRSIAENIPGLVYIYDVMPGGVRKMVYVGPGWDDLIGGAAAEHLADDFERVFDIMHPDDRTRLDLSRGVAALSEDAAEYRIRTETGDYRWVRSTGRPTRRDDGVTRWHCVLIDVTDRRQAEEDRRVLEDQLRQSQKMEAIGQLAGGVAHDFNNLLTVIIGNVELLQERLEGDSSSKTALGAAVNQIGQAAARASSLTGQLLAFSRRHASTRRVLNLNHVLLNMEEMLRRLVGGAVKFRLTTTSNLDCIHADASHLEQVVLNLAVNARDAMPDGGDLIVETANVFVDSDQAALHPDAEVGQYVLLRVCDTGAGMASEVLEHIFEPFFTTKAVGKGTGLGLSTVYGIVHQDAGYIEVDSHPNRGSEFRVFWPIVVGGEAEEEAGEQTEGLEGSETVLVCEDDDLVRMVASRMLESRGFTVLTARDAREAMAIARENHGTIDLLLSDIVMPEMNGLKLAKQLLKSSPNLRVLFMSGHVSDAVMPEVIHVPGAQVIEKPFKKAELIRRVREALD